MTTNLDKTWWTKRDGQASKQANGQRDNQLPNLYKDVYINRSNLLLICYIVYCNLGFIIKNPVGAYWCVYHPKNVSYNFWLVWLVWSQGLAEWTFQSICIPGNMNTKWLIFLTLDRVLNEIVFFSKTTKDLLSGSFFQLQSNFQSNKTLQKCALDISSTTETNDFGSTHVWTDSKP